MFKCFKSLCFHIELVGQLRLGEFSGEGFLEDGLAEAGGALEVGGHHRLQLLDHAQPPLHFRNDPRLLGSEAELASLEDRGVECNRVVPNATPVAKSRAVWLLK
jgi:hypothetical protein